jgi:hypothetical protein
VTRALLGLLALIAASLTVRAEEPARFTGQTLVQMCQAEPSSIGCSAYLLGFKHGIEKSQLSTASGKPICLDNTSANDLRAEFLDFAQRHPEFLDRYADVIVVVLWMRSHPCK